MNILGICLYRKFLNRQILLFTDTGRKGANIIGVQQRRCTAADIDGFLCFNSIAFFKRTDVLQESLDKLGIRMIREKARLLRYRIKIAIAAFLCAEWDMNVKTGRLHGYGFGLEN